MNKTQNMTSSNSYSIAIQILNIGINMLNLGTQLSNIENDTFSYALQIENIGMQIQNIGNQIKNRKNLNNMNNMNNMRNMYNMNNMNNINNMNIMNNMNNINNMNNMNNINNMNNMKFLNNIIMLNAMLGMGMMMDMNKNKLEEEEEWMKGFKEGVEEVAGKEINIIFKTTQGFTISIEFRQFETIDYVIRTFFHKIGKPQLIKSNKICFLYLARLLKIGDMTKIEVFFKGNLNPNVFVNDPKNLIEG